jgi:Uncharacterized protein conserved in bacteria (DUF2330)
MRAARHILAFGLATAALVNLIEAPVAQACGCLSPPAVTAGDYAVNQSAEQIIFEAGEPGWVTAHVLIRYAGDPAQFGWLIPVPEAPELAISPVSAFGLLDQATAPLIQLGVDDLCPQSEWDCHYDARPSSGGGCGGAARDNASGGGAVEDASAGAGDAAGSQPPVTVINEQTVGDYQTVTFSASNAAAATQWLHDNGFIVNSTTSIYMESYIQANMVFVAAKLVPGAGVKAIKPLRMHYRAAYPSIPLILTAVAAQPHLTVTAFVFGNQAFRPMGYPVVTIPQNRLARDPSGRLNYPMLLARTVDEAGGNGFAIEYRGTAAPVSVGTSSCCTGSYDFCGIANNGQCECPGSELDQTDCAAAGDLLDGVALLQTLGTTYSWLTRITTRLSPEQMTFDPTFEPDFAGQYTGALSLYNTQASLAGCEASVIDKQTFAADQARQGCDAMYCGIGSKCVVTASGPACQCTADTVAQQFNDLDNLPSVTCVPTIPPVDLHAGGAVLPDPCLNVSCGAGTCLDRNGVGVCSCNPNTGAVLGSVSPVCTAIASTTGSPGAEDFSQPLRTLDVCAPPPPTCWLDAKYEKVGSIRLGVDCGDATPPADQQYAQDPNGCQEMRDPPPLAFIGGAWLVLAMILRRRRAR